MPDVLLCQGTALALPLKDESCHVCVTSPPYFQLRDYGVAAQLGLEITLDAYIIAIRQAFREVWRVLREDGTLWLNMGDSYNAHQNQRSSTDKAGEKQQTNTGSVTLGSRNIPKLKPKNLLGIPWRVAFALQADGWILRSDIIWHKLNPMPESVQDRPTRSHEYVFLFSKQARYFYDAEAVREPYTGHRDYSQPLHKPGNTHAVPLTNHFDGHDWHMDHGGRNLRSVWRIASEPLTGFQHYAAFPSALVRRCLLAGAPSQVCAACGAPWKQEIKRTLVNTAGWGQATKDHQIGVQAPQSMIRNGQGRAWDTQTTDHGWQSTCTCAAGTQPATILDPFCGSGTTLLVARELGHHAVGVDLSLPYLRDIARQRLDLEALALWLGASRPAPAVDYTALPLFGGH